MVIKTHTFFTIVFTFLTTFLSFGYELVKLFTQGNQKNIDFHWVGGERLP